MLRMTRRRILIVDDEPANIHVLGAALDETYETFFATTGARALQIARERKIDLVLLDVVMPGMDGFEVLRKLKSDELTMGIPVIFVTAQNEVDDEAQGFALGAVDYITKPVSRPIVRARVRTHLELKQQREMLEQQAFLDGLTGIANRRRFDERLLAEWSASSRRNEPISLLLLDVDFFKQYNDTYGHSTGDECLCRVAGALSEIPRRPEDLAARYGGEEFALLLPGSDSAGVRDRANELLRRVRDLAIPHGSSSVDVIVTVSIGAVTMTPDSSRKADMLVQAADELLYQAKSDGRNRCVLLETADGRRWTMHPDQNQIDPVRQREIE